MKRVSRVTLGVGRMTAQFITESRTLSKTKWISLIMILGPVVKLDLSMLSPPSPRGYRSQNLKGEKEALVKTWAFLVAQLVKNLPTMQKIT